MRTTTLGLILLSVTLSALAQVSFKFGVSASAGSSLLTAPPGVAGAIARMVTPGVVVGLLLYGVGTLLWLQVLTRTELSQAYPFVGLGFVLTSVFGVVLFGETITLLRGVGIVLVIAGIFAIARS